MPIGLRRLGHDQHHRVGGGQQSRQLAMPCTPSRAVRATKTGSASQADDPAGQLLADVARPDDQHPLAGQLVGDGVVPAALLAGTFEARELPEHRQQRGQRPLRGGRAVHAPGVAELHAVRHHLQQHVDSRGLRLDHPQPGHRGDARPVAHRVGAQEVRHPELGRRPPARAARRPGRRPARRPTARSARARDRPAAEPGPARGPGRRSRARRVGSRQQTSARPASIPTADARRSAARAGRLERCCAPC